MQFHVFVNNKDQTVYPNFRRAFGSSDARVTARKAGSSYHQMLNVERTLWNNIDREETRCDAGVGSSPDLVSCVSKFLEDRIGCR